MTLFRTSCPPPFGPAEQFKSAPGRFVTATPDNDCKLSQSLSGECAGMVDTMLSALTELKSSRVRHCAVAVRLQGCCGRHSVGRRSVGPAFRRSGVPAVRRFGVEQCSAMRRSDPTYRSNCREMRANRPDRLPAPVQHGGLRLLYRIDS